MSTGSFDGVSVVIPVLNEAPYLNEAVSRVLEQKVDVDLEVILALGPSKDNTNEVAAKLAQRDSRVKLVQSKTGKTAAGLNIAVRASKYQVIVRVDGHCELSPNYISTALETLVRTNADVVGGVMAATGITNFEKAVACAMRSTLGVGPAAFHVGGSEGEALTVYLGVFRRETLDDANGYDETFIRAQDWELNHRIRKSGGKIWFNPNLEVSYRPRSSLTALARQYFEYGRWRREVSRTYPETNSLRYLAPPLTFSALILSGLISIYSAISAASLFPISALPIAGYAGLVVIGGFVVSRKQSMKVKFYLPIVLTTMHLTWGFGFITSPKHLRSR
jgi:glycosyltransferase involved in cell wall biosynthesis